MQGWSWADYEQAPDDVIERIAEILSQQGKEQGDEDG